MEFPPKRLKNLLPANFMMEHLLQGLYGVDAPANVYSQRELATKYRPNDYLRIG